MICVSCRFLALLAVVAIISGTYGYQSHRNTFIVTVEPGNTTAPPSTFPMENHNDHTHTGRTSR